MPSPLAFTRPILYSFRRCLYAMRARMALWSSGLTVELREVVLGRKPAALLEASPKGTVPVLDLGVAGGVIEQSLEIMRLALNQSDPECWLSGVGPCLIQSHQRLGLKLVGMIMKFAGTMCFLPSLKER